METRKGEDKGSSVAVEQLYARLAKKLPPPPPLPWLTRWRMIIHEMLTSPSIDRRPLWWTLIRVGISVLIAISVFVVGGRVGFIIGLGLFVVGVGVSLRVRRLLRAR